MKTPMQKLIDRLKLQRETLKDHFEGGEWNDHRCSEIDNCIEVAESLLPEERQIVIDAFDKGTQQIHGTRITNLYGHNYYKETYGSNDKE